MDHPGRQLQSQPVLQRKGCFVVRPDLAIRDSSPLQQPADHMALQSIANALTAEIGHHFQNAISALFVAADEPGQLFLFEGAEDFSPGQSAGQHGPFAVGVVMGDT